VTILAAFVGGAAQALKGDTYSPFGIPIRDTSLKGAALEGLSTAAFDQAKKFTESLNDGEGYVEVSQGYPFLLFLLEDF